MIIYCTPDNTFTNNILAKADENVLRIYSLKNKYAIDSEITEDMLSSIDKEIFSIVFNNKLSIDNFIYLLNQIKEKIK